MTKFPKRASSAAPAHPKGPMTRIINGRSTAATIAVRAAAIGTAQIPSAEMPGEIAMVMVENDRADDETADSGSDPMPFVQGSFARSRPAWILTCAP